MVKSFCFACGVWFETKEDQEYCHTHEWDSFCHPEHCPGTSEECKRCEWGGEL